MTEGPYFIVVKGTNQRLTSGKNDAPRIYDTEEIAKKTIVDSIQRRTKMGLQNLTEYEQISAEEYNTKYAKLMGIMED